MNDYKELIECLKIRSEYNRDGGFWNEGVSDSIDAAIKAIEQLVKERDAAIADLYDMTDYYGDNCHYCAKGKDKPCAKCEWEWRGVRDEID